MSYSEKSKIESPTRVRYGVLAFVCVLSMITYLDRAAFPNLQEMVKVDMGLQSVADLGLAMTAFNLAYALFEVPTGWLGDRYGPRKTLIRVVLWWSAFVALTALAGKTIFGIAIVGMFGVKMLAVIRFMFGAGEAGAYPNIAKAIYNWFPLRERGRASGMVWMASRFLGGLTPLIMLVLIKYFRMRWEAILILFAMLGVVWCLAWWLWFRDRPEEKPEVNQAERDLIQAGSGPPSSHSGVPWGNILKSPTMWSICAMYFCINVGWYFNMNYLPAFLEEQHGINKNSDIGAIYKGGPLLAGMLGCWIGGWLTDRYVRRTGNLKWGRRIYGVIGHGLAGMCLIACVFAPDSLTFAILIALSGFTNDLTMASAWSTCQDIGRRHAAVVSGTMNMIGNLGGALITYVSPFILRVARDRYAEAHGIAAELLSKDQLREAMMPGWRINFVIFGVVYFFAMLFWFGIDATKPLESHRES